MKFFENNITDGIFRSFHDDIQNNELYKLHMFEETFMDTEMLADHIVLEIIKFHESVSRVKYGDEIKKKRDTIKHGNDRFLNNLLILEDYMPRVIFFYEAVLRRLDYFWFEVPYVRADFMKLSALLSRLCDNLRGCLCLLSLYPVYKL
jgi:hypothetical protein